LEEVLIFNELGGASMIKRNQRKLILIELNEINFDIVEKYCSLDEKIYRNLKKLISSKGI
jgi:hypothetical protein